MIALSWFNFFMVILNIDNVFTYRQNRLRIMTPITQQSGNTNQGNFTQNINFMFPPVNSIDTFPGKEEISSSITANGAVLPSPVDSQLPPTNPVFRENDITSSTNPVVTTVATNGVLPPSLNESQITPTNPIVTEDDITSPTYPVVTTVLPPSLSESQTTPINPVVREDDNTPTSSIVTSVVTNGPLPPSPSESQTTSTNPVVRDNEMTSSINPVVTTVATNGPLPPSLSESLTTPANPVVRDDDSTSSTNSVITTVATNGTLPPLSESQTTPTSPVVREDDITSTGPIVTSVTTNGELPPSPTESQMTPTNPVLTENDITSSTTPTVTSTISTVPTVTEVVINSPNKGATLNFTVECPVNINIIITSNNNGYELTTNLTLEPPTVGSTTTLTTTVTENSESTTANEIPVTTPSINENAVSITSENPLSSSSTIESTVDISTENVTSPTTVENTATTLSENAITTFSTVGSTVELVTEIVSSSTTENTTSNISETATTSSIAGNTDTENVTSPGITENTVTTVSGNPIASPNANENITSSLSDNPITTPNNTNEKIVQFLTAKPINIDLSDPAQNGNNLVFTTQSSVSSNTVPVSDLSDHGQNGINFGFTPLPSSGTQNIQPKMIFEKKCEEYHNMSSRKVRTTKVQVFIVGGTNSLPNEFPHMAALGYRQEPKEWLCGGSLISENYVITAAHCLSSSTLGEIQFVRLGTTYLQTETLESEDYNVIRRIPHPEYSAGMQYNDIALLQLDRPVTFSESIQPICLFSSKNILAQQTLIATGWGKTEPAGDVSPELQKVDLQYFPNSECQQIYAVVSQQDLPRGIDDKTQICAGSRNEQKDTCQGDSGGPLQIEENGIYYLVGITSFGIDCGRPGSPGVYTRVSYYIPWIEKIVWANE